jgi:hypothetical protein
MLFTGAPQFELFSPNLLLKLFTSLLLFELMLSSTILTFQLLEPAFFYVISQLLA